MRRSRTALVPPGLLLGALLAACGSGAPEPPAATGPVPGGETTAVASPGTGPGSSPAVPATPGSCAGIVLDAGARIASADLAACLTDYLHAAGSGRFEIRQADHAAGQRWALVDGGLYAIGTSDGEPSVVVTPGTGWVHDDGGWVRADPSGTPDEVLAADGVDLYRATSSPEMTYAMIAAAPGFTVGGRAEVALADGTTTSLWPVRADAAFQPVPAIPATTTELVVWTDVPGPTARIDVTGDAVDGAGQVTSGTSTTFFSDWGRGVDLAEIEELVGAPVPAARG